MNILDNTFSLHEKALGMRSQRMEVLSRNIAMPTRPTSRRKTLTSARS